MTSFPASFTVETAPEVTEGFAPADVIGQSFPIVGLDLDDFHAYVSLRKPSGHSFELVVDRSDFDALV